MLYVTCYVSTKVIFGSYCSMLQPCYVHQLRTRASGPLVASGAQWQLLLQLWEEMGAAPTVVPWLERRSPVPGLWLTCPGGHGWIEVDEYCYALLAKWSLKMNEYDLMWYIYIYDHWDVWWIDWDVWWIVCWWLVGKQQETSTVRFEDARAFVIDNDASLTTLVVHN